MKKRLINILTSLIMILIISACAPVDYSKEAVFPEAKPDQALIYFYRSPGFIGSTYRFNVYENKQVVGAMSQNSYFYLLVDPGQHIFVTDVRNVENKSSIALNVQSGKTYYVKVDVEYEVIGGTAVFSEVDESEAMTLLPSRMYVVPAKINPSTYNVHAEQ